MRRIVLAVGVFSFTAAVGCHKKEAATAAPASTASAASAAPAKKAGGKIESKSGSKVTGDVSFTQNGTNTTVVVHVMGAAPGDHGVHVHQKGDCSAADAASAGGHFNPTAQAHGAPNAAHHHAGDLGNIHVGADGAATLTLTVNDLTADNGPNGVVGRALIVHGKPDDMTSQPAGNAGPREGCAVISAM